MKNYTTLNREFGIDAPLFLPEEDTEVEYLSGKKKWYNNGEQEAEFYPQMCVPDGWIAGRLSAPRCKWKQPRCWWNNGTDSKLSTDAPGSDWVRGRIMSEQHKEKFKCQPGRQKGIAKNTNRRRDSKGKLLPSK